MRIVAIMMDDVIPLYFSSPVDAGGLAFGTQEIGVTLILNGVSLVIFQLFVFYRLEKRWGCIRCYRYGVQQATLLSSLFEFMWLFAAYAPPLIFSFFAGAYSSIPLVFMYPVLTLCEGQPWLLWTLISVFAVWRTTSFSIMFTSVMMLINNRSSLDLSVTCAHSLFLILECSANSKTIGLVNGISQVLLHPFSCRFLFFQAHVFRVHLHICRD
jgi:hypothetical protein